MCGSPLGQDGAWRQHQQRRPRFGGDPLHQHGLTRVRIAMCNVSIKLVGNWKSANTANTEQMHDAPCQFPAGHEAGSCVAGGGYR